VHGDAAVWWERTPDGASEFTPIEPALIPRAVARAVGLEPRAETDFEGRLELPGAALQPAVDKLAKGDVEGADRKLARTTSLDATERKVLCKLFLEHRLSWQVISVWRDAQGEQVGSVAVVDGGESGLWLSEHDPPGSDDDNTLVQLEPISAGALWERIVALVPLPVPSSAGAGADG